MSGRDLVDKPISLSKVRRRRLIKAAAKRPPPAKVALARFWMLGRTRPTVTRHVVDPTVFTIEAPFGALAAPRSRIRVEALDSRKMKRLDGVDAAAGPGWVPRHLDVSFAPPTTGRLTRGQRRQSERRFNGVFPPDERNLLQSRSYPWCTVGRVDTPGGGGTGTMVGRRLMLMASHSAVRRAGEYQPIEFTPAYYDGPNTFGSAWGERIIYWKAIDGSAQITDDLTAFDYAVVVLDLPIGLLTGYVGYRTYDPSWNNQKILQHVGYPTDLANYERPYLTEGTMHSADAHPFQSQTGYVMGHVLDTAPGHSGGPFWAWFSEERFPRVVGVDSTGINMPRPNTASDNEAGGGPALSKLISYARQNYP